MHFPVFQAFTSRRIPKTTNIAIITDDVAFVISEVLTSYSYLLSVWQHINNFFFLLVYNEAGNIQNN
jgi:hypothetical protein